MNSISQCEQRSSTSTSNTAATCVKVNSFLTKTSSQKKKSLDDQVARFVFATKSSFQSGEHPEFKKLMSDLRPGYVPPNRQHSGGTLLDMVHSQELERCKTILEGQSVTLGLDGWSNVHNEPVICVTLTTGEGVVYLADTIDTSSHSHLYEYVDVWKDLMDEFTRSSSHQKLHQFQQRYDMAIQPVHFLAYVLHPKQCHPLTPEEKDMALDFANRQFGPKLVVLCLKFEAQSTSFRKIYFPQDREAVRCMRSTAGVEGVFSTFGLIQSKLRNRLGLEKAAKLVQVTESVARTQYST